MHAEAVTLEQFTLSSASRQLVPGKALIVAGVPFREPWECQLAMRGDLPCFILLSLLFTALLFVQYVQCTDSAMCTWCTSRPESAAKPTIFMYLLASMRAASPFRILLCWRQRASPSPGSQNCLRISPAYLLLLVACLTWIV